MNSQDKTEIWRKFHAWGTFYRQVSDLTPPCAVIFPLLLGVPW